MDEIEKVFSKRLKILRVERGMKQDDLAKKLGILQTSIGGYEAGKNLPRPDVLVKISKLFNVSLDYLLGLEDSKRRDEFIKFKLPETISKTDMDKLLNAIILFSQKFLDDKKKLIKYV
jgi:transcriptional regulator with XRE-family HTH domain